MIQHTVYNTKGKPKFIESIGWGKTLTCPWQDQKEIEKKTKWAEGKIVLAKIYGFVKQRELAYKAKSFNNQEALKNVKLLLNYISIIGNKSNMDIYRMIVTHEFKLRTILPSKANEMNIYIPEIINWCKKQLSNN